MSDTCDEYITLALSITGGVLLVFSELLGMQSDKNNKCTSIIQVICACCLWTYRKIQHLCCCCRRQTQIPEDPSVEELVSRHVSIKYPTWRGRKVTRASIEQPLNPPPVSHGTLGEDLSNVLSQHLGADSVVVVISRPPSASGHRDSTVDGPK